MWFCMLFNKLTGEVLVVRTQDGLRLRVEVQRYIKPGECWKRLPSLALVWPVAVSPPRVGPGELTKLVEWLKQRRLVDRARLVLTLTARNTREWDNALSHLRVLMPHGGYRRPSRLNPKLEVCAGTYGCAPLVLGRERALAPGGWWGTICQLPAIGVRIELEGRPTDIAPCVEDIFMVRYRYAEASD
jgi:hypothetical protein